ncbi:hypothetical protein K2X40_04805 [Candidatus Babeliales bacterium]|nr:hypothetical protein [Candidatus Babeliales bacterium]
MFKKIIFFSLFAFASRSLHGTAFRFEDIETYDIMHKSAKKQHAYFETLQAFILQSLRGKDRILIRHITGKTIALDNINKDAFNELVQLAKTELNYATEHPQSFEKEARRSATHFNEWNHQAGKPLWQADYELLSLINVPECTHTLHPVIIQLNFHKMVVYISNPSFFSDLWALF